MSENLKTNSDAVNSPIRRRRVKGKKEQKILRFVLTFVVTIMCICVIAVCTVSIVAAMYLVKVTVDDENLLDLNSLEMNYASSLMAFDDATGEWYEYQRLYASDNRVWVNYEDLPKELIDVLVASEDQRFWLHKGVDIKRTVMAFLNEYVLKRAFYDRTQGASTITQQMIKNITSEDEVSGSAGALRKLREIYRAFMLEREYSKEQILEAYLNTVNFGGMVYGIESAADYYFGTTASELTTAQSAAIICITKYPGLYDPYIDAEENKYQREDVILWMMHENGFLNDREYSDALAESATFDFSTVKSNTSLTNDVWTYFTDTAVESVIDDLVDYKNMTHDEAEKLLFNGGLKVYLTIDPKVQTVVDDVAFNAQDYNNTEAHSRYTNTNTYRWFGTQVKGFEDTDNYDIWPVEYQTDENGDWVYDDDGFKVPIESGKQVQSGMVVMNYDGEIVGIAGGVREKATSRSLNRAYGKTARRNTGSSIKPIAAYAPAIEMNAVHMSTAFPDTPFMQLDGNEWPRNYSRQYGAYGANITVYEGVCVSLNTTAVWTLSRVGYDYAFDFMKNSLNMYSLVDSGDGVYDANGEELFDRGIGLTLGDFTYGITPVEMAGAFMIFGDSGYFVEPHCYTKVVDSEGNVILDKEKLVLRDQAISEETAWIMNRIMKGVFAEGTLTAARQDSGTMEYIGKSGTSSNNTDFWTCAMNPYYVMTLWEGYDDHRTVPDYRPHANQLAFKEIMKQITVDLEDAKFTPSDNVYTASFCMDSGDLASAGCTTVRTGYYKRGGPAPSGYCAHELIAAEEALFAAQQAVG